MKPATGKQAVTASVSDPGPRLSAAPGVSGATAYRYRDEGVKVLAEQEPDLHEALAEVAEQGWSHVVIDGTLVRSDHCVETTTSVRGETINSWYSGKHRAPGRNVQAAIRPDGLPVWVSEVCARAFPRPHRGPRRRCHRCAEVGRLPARPAYLGRLRLRGRRPRDQGAGQTAC